MKKMPFFSLLIAWAAGVACAATPNATVDFATTGPDTYADGTPVADGETYYLLFVPAGSTFTIDNTGAVEGARIVFQGKAKDGACGRIVVELNSGADYSNGTFRVVLLDTRNASGAPVGDIVVAYGASETASALPSGAPGMVRLAAAQQAAGSAIATRSGAAILPTVVPPVITGLAVEGGVATLTAKADGRVYYTVSVTENLSSGIWTPVTNRTEAQTFAADGGGVAIAVDPAKKAQFFKIEVAK